MADNTAKGPKDITPNPLAEAAKTAATPEATPPPETDPVQEAPDNGAWLRALKIALVVAAGFLIFMGVAPAVFFSTAAIPGAILLALAAWLEIGNVKKLKKEPRRIDFVLRYILLGLACALLALYIVEIFKPLAQKINTDILVYGLLAAFLVFSAEFLLYVFKNPKKILFDIILFSGAVVAVIALYSFYFFLVISSFALAALALVLALISVGRDPLKDDGRLWFRVPFAVVVILSSIIVYAYAATIYKTNLHPVLDFVEISPVYKQMPQNLAWSNDTWALAYNVYDSKKGENKLDIIHGLTRGVTEIPGAGAEAKMPKFIEPPVWNKKGNMLVFSGADGEKEKRNIWGVSVNVAMIDLPEKLKEKYMDVAYNEKKLKEEKKKDAWGWFGKLKIQDLYTGKVKTPEDQLAKIEYEKEVHAKDPDAPPGRPKTLVTSFDRIIDLPSFPVTHKTAWSPDAKSFVIAATGPGQESNLWKTDINSQSLMQLTKGFSKMMPLWSPKGDKILYVSKIDSYTFLEISEADGANPRELDSKNKKDRELFPLWNSGENKVIYYKKGKFVIMNANATDQKDLSKETLVDSPYWLTENKKHVNLRFTESGNIWRIWTIKPDGKGNKEIFRQKCVSMSQPKWAYDGSAIAVACNSENSGAIWRLNEDGSDRLQLYTTKHQLSELEWAPSSERLAFLVEKKMPKEQELWVINNNGTNPLMTFWTKGSLSHISWNMLGQRIAFEETYRRFYFHPDITTIHVVNAVDGVVWNLLPYEFFGKYPTWTDDSSIIAYVGWDKFYSPTKPFQSYRIWGARIQ